MTLPIKFDPAKIIRQLPKLQIFKDLTKSTKTDNPLSLKEPVRVTLSEFAESTPSARACDQESPYWPEPHT